MNKIKRVLFLIIAVFCMGGCLGKMTPSETVETMLNRYIKNDKDIMEQLNTFMDEQNLTDAQKDRYKKIIKDEYSTLKYKITNERIIDDKATVDVEIEVKNLYSAGKEAGNYLVDNPDEFYDDDVYNEEKFIDYKLDMMENTNETIKHNISLTLTKADGEWELDDIPETTLEKIHGIYDYETNYKE